jgi:hypothetical protein
MNNKWTYFYKLLDKEHKNQLVVENEKETYLIRVAFFKITLIPFSLAPYYMYDTDVYDLFEELEEDEFNILLAKHIAKSVHKSQTDKAGVDYFAGHLTTVANGVNNKAKVVAYLHDSLEDTKLTDKELLKVFDKDIVKAIKVLTKPKNVKYLTYIRNVKTNPLAKAVKLSDLRNNSDLSRLPKITEKDLQRKEKYEKAIKILEN